MATNTKAEKADKVAKTRKTDTPQKTVKPEVVWGSPDYLKLLFDDIDTVTELARTSTLGAAVRRLVKVVSTPKDNLAVHRTYRTVGRDAEGVREDVVVWISFGLNGNGSQADYFAALQRLVRTNRFYVFDAITDACDDVADVLCFFRPEAKKADKAQNADHRKQRGRTAPNRAGKAPAKPEAR